jgi:hypothetical protein
MQVPKAKGEFDDRGRGVTAAWRSMVLKFWLVRKSECCSQSALHLEVRPSRMCLKCVIAAMAARSSQSDVKNLILQGLACKIRSLAMDFITFVVDFIIFEVLNAIICVM